MGENRTITRSYVEDIVADVRDHALWEGRSRMARHLRLDQCLEALAAREPMGHGGPEALAEHRYGGPLEHPFPMNLEAIVREGSSYEVSDPDRARACYERVLELDPGHPDALYNLALAPWIQPSPRTRSASAPASGLIRPSSSSKSGSELTSIRLI